MGQAEGNDSGQRPPVEASKHQVNMRREREAGEGGVTQKFVPKMACSGGGGGLTLGLSGVLM